MKLQDCCIFISDGDHQAPPKSDKGVPFITISNITTDNRIDFSNVMYVPLEYYEQLSEKSKAIKNDILYSVVGSFGKPVLIEEDRKFVFQRHIAILRPNLEKVIPEFLYYTLLNPQFYTVADYLAIGAAQRTISLESLRNIEIELPSLSQQKRIVDVIAPIDKKIHENAMINDYLEEMAKTIYDYWFVQFEFPDENGNPYKTSGGKMKYSPELNMNIPISWEISTLKDRHTIDRGISYTSKDISEETGTPMINLACIDINRNYRDGQLKYYNNCVSIDKSLVGNELLIACTDLTRNADIVGSPILVPKLSYKMTYSMDMAKLNFDSKYFDKYYLYMTLRTEYYHNFIKKYASGTNVLHLNLDGLNWYTMWIPPRKLQYQFGCIIQKIQSNKNIVIHENNQLIQLRDWLLPMLMNGQAAIED